MCVTTNGTSNALDFPAVYTFTSTQQRYWMKLQLAERGDGAAHSHA